MAGVAVHVQQFYARFYTNMHYYKKRSHSFQMINLLDCTSMEAGAAAVIKSQLLAQCLYIVGLNVCS